MPHTTARVKRLRNPWFAEWPAFPGVSSPSTPCSATFYHVLTFLLLSRSFCLPHRDQAHVSSVATLDQNWTVSVCAELLLNSTSRHAKRWRPRCVSARSRSRTVSIRHSRSHCAHPDVRFPLALSTRQIYGRTPSRAFCRVSRAEYGFSKSSPRSFSSPPWKSTFAWPAAVPLPLQPDSGHYLGGELMVGEQPQYFAGRRCMSRTCA